MKNLKVISRKNAKAKGLKKYYTGATCVNGHIAERRVANYECIACEKARKTQKVEAVVKVIKKVIRVVTFAGDRRTNTAVINTDNLVYA